MKTLKIASMLLGAALFTAVGTTSAMAKCTGEQSTMPPASKCTGDKKTMMNGTKCTGDKKMKVDGKCGNKTMPAAPVKGKCGAGKCTG